MADPDKALATQIRNIKSLAGSPRLAALSAGQMCRYRVKLTGPAEVDAELVGWIKAAYDAAG